MWKIIKRKHWDKIVNDCVDMIIGLKGIKRYYDEENYIQIGCILNNLKRFIQED